MSEAWTVHLLAVLLVVPCLLQVRVANAMVMSALPTIRYITTALIVLCSTSICAVERQHPEVVPIELPGEVYSLSGYVDLVYRKPEQRCHGNFHIIKNSVGNILYQKFEPDSTCTSAMLHFDEVIDQPDLRTYIQVPSKSTGMTIPSVVFVQPKPSPVRLPTSGFDSDFLMRGFNALHRLTTSSTIVKLTDSHFQTCIPGNPNETNHPDRFIEFWTDSVGRLTRGVYSTAIGKRSPIKTDALSATYSGSSTFPASTKIEALSDIGDNRIEFVQFTDVQVIDNQTTDIKPTLLFAGSEVQDYRFTPPLIYISKGTDFPSIDELFEMAAKRKSEQEAQARSQAQAAAVRAATVDNPRNIKDAPLTKESWGKRLRTIPNWVYGGAIVLVFFGWIVSKGRKN